MNTNETPCICVSYHDSDNPACPCNQGGPPLMTITTATNETPTPRTDAEVHKSCGGKLICVHADFARTLERENAQLRQLCMEAGIGDYKANYYLGKLTLFGELDSARQQIADEKALREYSERNQITLQKANAELRQQLAEAQQEIKDRAETEQSLSKWNCELKARNVQLREALEENHQWHKDYMGDDGYETSHLEQLNTAALSTNPESSLLNELQALREDKERLDWMIEHHRSICVSGSADITVENREAIDAARGKKR